MKFLPVLITLVSLLFVSGSILAFFNSRRISQLRKEITSLKEILYAKTSPSPEHQGIRKDASLSVEPASFTEDTHSGTETMSARETGKTGLGTATLKQRKTRSSGRIKRKKFLSKADDAFAHYWTGILGVIGVVVGFSFLAILTALRLGHFARFLMLIGVAALFFAASRLIQHRSRVKLFSAWFQSAAGALVLFACLGSAVIPWLQWVSSEPAGYLLLAAGIAINLILALTGSVPWFASFHILISLAALAVAPSGTATLVAAAFVTGVCSVPALKRSWGLHLLIAETAYFAFVSIWYINHPFPGEATGIFASLGLLTAFIPGLLAPYLSQKDTKTPFGITARTASWLYLGVGALAFAPNSGIVSVLFLLIGATVYFIPRITLISPLPWLFRIDTISALGLALFAAIGLIRIEMNSYLITAIAYTLALLVAMDTKADQSARNAALGTEAFLGILIILSSVTGSFGLLFPLTGTLSTIQSTAITMFLFLFTAAQIYFSTPMDEKHIPWQRILSAALLTLILSALFAQTMSLKQTSDWLRLSGAILIPAGLIGFFVNRHRRIPVFPVGLAIIIALAHIFSVFLSIRTRNYNNLSLPWIIHDLILLSTALLLIYFSGKKRGNIPAAPGIILATFDLLIINFTLTASLDNPWMVFLMALQSIAGYAVLRKFARRLRNDMLRPVEVLSIIVSCLAAALVILLQMSGEFETTSPVFRFAAEFLSVLSIGIWAWEPAVRSNEASRILWSVTAVGAASLFLAVEVPGTLIAIALAFFAIGILYLSTKGPALLNHLKTLSLIPWVIALITTLFSTGGGFFKDFSMFSKDWWLSLGGSAVTLTYIVLFYIFKGITSASLERFIQKYRSRILFLPWFITIGIFLVFSFKGPALTTLLILESFSLFTLGILHKEALFRPFSYGLLVYSLFRLIFIDLKETDTLGRAVIFIVAGALMLGMNWIYGRFGRTEDSASSITDKD